MEELNSIKKKISQMSQIALSMLRNTFDGFMKHDADILSAVLEDEQRLNDLEKSVTVSLVKISKGKISASDKKNLMRLVNIAAHLEEIGDYVKDMVERIEIKIEEKLLFSDDAVDEYKHLYNAVESELEDVDKALKTDDRDFAKRVLCGKGHADKLAEKYRQTHAKRLIAGVCQPFACNTFLNLLDFTAGISRHTKAIAKNILWLK